MSSRIVRPDRARVRALPWSRADNETKGGAGGGRPNEAAEPRAVIASLQARLEATERAAVDREARAREAGRQEGIAAGFQEAAAAAQEQANRALAALRAEAAESAAASASQVVDLRRRLRQQMEADLVRLAVAVARRILRRELSVDPSALLGIVKAAVERISLRELLVIRVSSHDASRVSARLTELMLPERVEIVADAALAPGSVVFDTTRGHHDASVETQIDEIDRGLADLVGRPE